MMRSIFLGLSLIILMSGCGLLRKTASTAPHKGNIPDNQSAVTMMEQSAAQFSTLTFNAEISIKAGETENSVTGTIRIKKDSMIWISARKFGFEIGRLMLSQDSVWMLDRINSQYFAGDYRFFRQKFNIDVDYNLIEAMLLGNPLINWSADPVKTECLDEATCNIMYPERYRINQGRDLQSRPEGSTVTEEHITLSRSDGRIIHHTLEILGEQRKITAQYASFKKVNQSLIPSAVILKIDNQGVTTALNIQVETFKDNEVVRFPFKIQGNYTPIPIK